MTSTDEPVFRSKPDLESFVKEHGGTVVQSETAQKDIIVIADKGMSMHCPQVLTSL